MDSVAIERLKAACLEADSVPRFCTQVVAHEEAIARPPSNEPALQKVAKSVSFQDVSVPSPEPDHQEHSAPQPRTTRSGRVIRPPPRYQ